MSVFKDIVDGIGIVADAIKNITEIHAAIKNGKKYFEIKHPEIKKDVAAMCVELQKTCNAIAVASRVITNFRFNASPGAIDNEPTRFNDYFIMYKNDRNEAENLIRSLKGHCHIIKIHADKISNGNTNTFWGLLGFESGQREQELANRLQEIYNDEKDLYSIVYVMSKSMNLAIEDVTNALTVNGMMVSDKVPGAASLLSEYAKEFKKLEILAENTREDLDNTIMELQ